MADDQLLHLSVQLISKSALNHTDQKAEHDATREADDQEKYHCRNLVNLAFEENGPLEEHDQDHCKNTSARYKIES